MTNSANSVLERLSDDDLLEAHRANQKSGGNIHTLEEKTGVKWGTLNSRLNGLRKSLKDKGYSKEAVNAVIPMYGYRSGPRAAKVKTMDKLEAMAKEFMMAEVNKKQTPSDKTDKTEKTA